ncbi:MAG: hypothetical protein RL367_2088 [Pseudomonadota bacterium]
MFTTIHLQKDDLTRSTAHHAEMPPLGAGKVRLRVESFAVTANNVTYAVIGDMFGYWNFFPAAEGFGVVPVWGHAVVEASNHPDILVGERVYGYLPMGTHLDVAPGKVSDGGFTDMTDYRQPMAAIYNQYSRLNADPEHDPAREDARMVFGPLFKTGFLIEAMFRREGWFGADALIMTSASSKTALALAWCARAGSPGVRRIGLTSPANVDFVRASGLYDQVVTYDVIDTLDMGPSVAVDFAGNASVGRAIHTRLGDALAYSCSVGVTHVGARSGSAAPLPGPAPILFFAPDHAAATIRELGPKGFGEAVGERWRGFVAGTDGYMTVEHRCGVQAAADAFAQTLAGTARPDVGIVVRP